MDATARGAIVTRRKPKPRSQARRSRKMVALTLSDEARAALDRLAVVIGSKSAAADAAILAFDRDTEPTVIRAATMPREK